MKLITRLLIGGKDYKLISEETNLATSSPGRATFSVKTNDVLSGDVIFMMQYATGTEFPYFIGLIENQYQKDDNNRIITCREFSSLLTLPVTLSLRHCTINAVLNAITEKTGLVFVTPSTITTKRVARFSHLGTGVHALKSLGSIFGLKNFVWFQTTEGRIYVGSRNDTKAENNPVDLPIEFFTGRDAADSATVPAVPTLRPGAIINGNRIKSVLFKSHKMVLSW